MQKKFYKRNNKRFYNLSKKFYNRGDYNKNIKRKPHFDGRSSETRLIIDRFLEKDTPYIRYDLEDILYDEQFVKKMDLYQECRILRLGCQLQPLNSKGVISVYYDDLCSDQQVRHVVYPVSKVINLSWHNIRKNMFDSTFKFGKLCFVNKNRLRFKCQIRIVIIFQGKKSDELKGVNWDDVSFSKNSSVSSITKESQSTSSDKNSLSSLVNSISKAKTSIEPSGDLNMVLDNNQKNDFTDLMKNKMFRSFEDFLEPFYYKARKAKNLLDKRKREYNKLAGTIKDFNNELKKDVDYLNKGLIDQRIEDKMKFATGTIALMNNKVKQFDEKLKGYETLADDLKNVESTFNTFKQGMLNMDEAIKFLLNANKNKTEQIKQLQKIQDDDIYNEDDCDLESDFGYTDQPKKSSRLLFDVYSEAENYMLQNMTGKQRKLHKIVYKNKLHKYEIV